MKIVVTVKLVPDPNAEKRIDPNTKRLVRTGVETVLNPYDEYALEAALQIKEKVGGDSTVTVFSMAPESLKETLRKALAMGADDAVLLTDAALEGSDVWGTSTAIAKALERIGFDILLVGGLSDDGSTGVVPGAVAELLGKPLVTNVRKAEVNGSDLALERETDTGYQDVSVSLPAVLTTALTFGEPRYASLKGIMGAKKKTIALQSAAEIGLDAQTGAAGAKTELVSVAPPPVRGKGQVVEAADGASGAQTIFAFLKERKLV